MSVMSGVRTLYRGEQQIDFPRLWRRALVASAAVVLVSVGSLAVRGLNLGIEFEGGTSWEVRAPEVSVGEARDALRSTSAVDAKIQIVGGDTIRVRSGVDDSAVDEVRDALAELAGVPAGEVSITSVGPSWGSEITGKAVNALVWFLVLVSLYIAVRLEWKMAIGALAAVAHDTIISVGVYSLFGFEVTPATVIAFLTIMGYSLYDTIVVYDKVREVSGRVGATGRYTYTEMMNLSLNRVLMRSINTSVTSVLPVLSMLLIGSLVLGAVTLEEFAIALLVGLLVGAYSSIFVASALVAWLKEREPEHRDVAARVNRKGSDEAVTRTIEEVDAGSAEPVTRRASGSGAPTTIAPRPRKKKKKKRS